MSSRQSAGNTDSRDEVSIRIPLGDDWVNLLLIEQEPLPPDLAKTLRELKESPRTGRSAPKTFLRIELDTPLDDVEAYILGLLLHMDLYPFAAEVLKVIRAKKQLRPHSELIDQAFNKLQLELRSRQKADLPVIVTEDVEDFAVPGSTRAFSRIIASFEGGPHSTGRVADLDHLFNALRARAGSRPPSGDDQADHQTG